MEYLPEFLTIASIHLLAVMSPGPDFILITRNSLIYSRKTGMYSALGLGLGIMVHIAYSLIGIGLIIAKSVLLFTVIKFIGAGYLIYIGYKSVTAKATHVDVHGEKKDHDLTLFQAVKMGFFCNVTNPKATLFFLSLFTQVIDPSTPLAIQFLYSVEMTFATVGWFMLVATAFSHGYLKHKLAKVQKHTEQVMGVILIALGVKLALTSSK
jgi:RhtB (resistance to homoserine/threonine) family protein